LKVIVEKVHEARSCGNCITCTCTSIQRGISLESTYFEQDSHGKWYWFVHNEKDGRMRRSPKAFETLESCKIDAVQNVQMCGETGFLNDAFNIKK